jgi:hypothetical protein
LLLLLYVVVDFTDPSIPGVFFFDSSLLFVDSAIQLKSGASTHRTAAEPMPFGGLADEQERAATKVQVATRPHSPQQRRWRSLIRSHSASFASSSPDSSPTPPLA